MKNCIELKDVYAKAEQIKFKVFNFFFWKFIPYLCFNPKNRNLVTDVTFTLEVHKNCLVHLNCIRVKAGMWHQ